MNKRLLITRLLIADYLLTSVTNITSIVEIGAYAPLTSNGHLVVNNYFASCHSFTDTMHLQQAFFFYMRKIEALLWSLFGFAKEIDQGTDSFVDIPTGSWYLMNAIDYLLPNVNFVSLF